MARAWLNHLAGDLFEAHSAALDPLPVHPLAVEVMREAGVDISEASPRRVFDVFRSGMAFSHVIRIDTDPGGRGPIFPGSARRHADWDFPRPADDVPHEDQLRRMREIRDAIRARVEQFFDAACIRAAA